MHNDVAKTQDRCVDFAHFHGARFLWRGTGEHGLPETLENYLADAGLDPKTITPEQVYEGLPPKLREEFLAKYRLRVAMPWEFD